MKEIETTVVAKEKYGFKFLNYFFKKNLIDMFGRIRLTFFMGSILTIILLKYLDDIPDGKKVSDFLQSDFFIIFGVLFFLYLIIFFDYLVSWRSYFKTTENQLIFVKDYKWLKIFKNIPYSKILFVHFDKSQDVTWIIWEGKFLREMVFIDNLQFEKSKLRELFLRKNSRIKFQNWRNYRFKQPL